MVKIIKAGILGGVILFIWSAISWMALPWHKNTIHSFSVEKAVTQSIQSNAPFSGIYFLPSMHHQMSEATITTNAPEPMIFAAVTLEGMHPMMISMVISFITQLIAAFFVAWMLMQANNLRYVGRLCFVIIFALAAGVITDIPYWNWFGFDRAYTLVQFADLIIGWSLAGLALAKICKK